MKSVWSHSSQSLLVKMEVMVSVCDKVMTPLILVMLVLVLLEWHKHDLSKCCEIFFAISLDICCWWVWVIWTVDRDVIAYFSQCYFYRVEIVVEEIWCCLQSWNRGTYEELQELAIELIELGMPGLSERGGKSFCWNVASLIKKLPLASFGCYEKVVGYMPLILCLSGCMCHKQSAFCYRFSMLSTEKCECLYFMWKWVRWLQGAITKGNCVSCKRLIWSSPLQAESAMAALNCSGAILGSLPIRVSPSKTPVRPRSPRPPLH
jgi:hypothetical protein